MPPSYFSFDLPDKHDSACVHTCCTDSSQVISSVYKSAGLVQNKFIIFRGKKQSLLKLIIITLTHTHTKGVNLHPTQNYVTILQVLGVFWSSSLNVCPLAVLRRRVLSFSIPAVYLDLSSSLMRVLSFKIISCRQQSDQL